jgi:hypothetical protein
VVFEEDSEVGATILAKIKAEEVSIILAVVSEADAVVKAVHLDQAIKDHSMEVKAAL